MTLDSARFDIHTVLERTLLATDLDGLPVALPNNEFHPGSDGPNGYLRPTLLPASTQPSTIGVNGLDYHSGLYQIDIFTPVGRGRHVGEKLATRLAGSFPRGGTLSYNGVEVHVVSFSSGSGPVVEGFSQLPVLVEYYAVL